MTLQSKAQYHSSHILYLLHTPNLTQRKVKMAMIKPHTLHITSIRCSKSHPYITRSHTRTLKNTKDHQTRLRNFTSASKIAPPTSHTLLNRQKTKTSYKLDNKIYKDWNMTSTHRHNYLEFSRFLYTQWCLGNYITPRSTVRRGIYFSMQRRKKS